MTSQFISIIISEAYFLKLLISINRRKKLRLDLPKDTYIESLLPLTYYDSKLKSKDPNKICKSRN
jgi:hypothetical protein